MKSRGFTLIELLVVIAIIGLLATFSVVQLAGSREKARIAKGLSFSSQITHIAGDEAVGMWDFDECTGDTSYDKSGLGNNATLVNTPEWSTDTPSGKGCSMRIQSASQQYAVINNVLPKITSNRITVSVWAKSATEVWNDFGWIMSARTDFIIHPFQNERRLCIYFADGSSWLMAPETTPSNITNWHHYAFTYDSQTFIFYIDGKDIWKQNIGAYPFSYPNNPLYLGVDSPASGRFGDGWIDDAQIFNKALTATDIRYLYAEGGGESNIAKE